MSTQRAPKQWSLTKNETITTFESWRQNLIYILSLDTNFAPFLITGATWQKKLRTNPMRGLQNDPDMTVRGARTGAQKVAHLELMLGQIANFCPIISRNTIIKNSVSLDQIWQAIRAHFGFQSSGAHFLDLVNIKLKPDERPEDLFQRLTAFVEDNLLLMSSGLQHHGEPPAEDEEMTPTLENLVVLIWLQLIHKDLPSLVKQRYGTELRSRTLASIKPEISQALDSLLETLRTTEDAKVMRSAIHSQASRPSYPNRPPYPNRSKTNTRSPVTKSCPICKVSGLSYNHYLSRCPNLPESDRRFLTRARMIATIDEEEESEAPASDELPDLNTLAVTLPSSRRVQVNQSPFVMMHHKHHAVKLTLDSGAETNMIKASTAHMIGAPISASSQIALQADGRSQLKIVGETKLYLHRNSQSFKFDALVVENLDVDILAGVPFMCTNDISLRPAKFEITFGDGSTYKYNVDDRPPNRPTAIQRASVHVLRSPSATVWPGEFLQIPVPDDLGCADIAVEPRIENKNNPLWPPPSILTPVAGCIRIPNLTDAPQVLRKNCHFAQAIPLAPMSEKVSTQKVSIDPHIGSTSVVTNHTEHNLQQISVDPDSLLPADIKSQFISLHKEFSSVFNSKIQCYNGALGPLQAVVHMGPVQPPQRKGRVPMYARDKLVELQAKFDELEAVGVFAKPEDIGVNVEYLNPSFLVKKPSGGHRLVTSFGEVARYAKPQPALMPDINTTLQTIGQWKYLITTDLTKAFYQIPLAKESSKYCGVATPFKGTRVYTRSAMGMPGSETALEELMSRVLGSLVQEGVVAKIADDLYCGGSTPAELLNNWKRVLSALQSCNLVLSAPKTVIAPKSTTILGWIWSQGQLRASPHRIATLSTCERPNTVKGLRSFLGAYKFLARVIPRCSSHLAPLEAVVAGKPSHETIQWTTDTEEAFLQAQHHLADNQTITLPRCSDRLWLVTDAAVKNHGIASTLYVNRDGNIKLAGYFSAKLKERQSLWLPCEVEALCIASSIRHFSPYIIQSNHQASILTDSKPCVEAYQKLMRGCFSNSARVTTMLAAASRFAVTIQHLSGSSNVPSDFGSRNAPLCDDARCQICAFVADLQQATVLRIEAADIISGKIRLPFTTRSAWLSTQTECGDLRRVHAHLSQGTRPSKRLTNIRDVKRYLQLCTIAKDGMLVVARNEPFTPTQDRIVVPRHVLHGLLTALHIRLDHPTHHQLKQVFTRYFFALDLEAALTILYSTCHTCVSLQKLPKVTPPQSTSEPPTAVGLTYATDVLRRDRQFILVVRESVTSFTAALLIPGEDHTSLRNGLLRICVGMCPLAGPPAVIRCDPGPGFAALTNDEILTQHGITIDIGRIKNRNKNPIAEKAIQELEDELLRCDPDQPIITDTTLAIVVARLNSRVRHQGLSARELLMKRDQFTHSQLPIDDQHVISQQQAKREAANSYHNLRKSTPDEHPVFKEGDIVYLVNERTKMQPRPRYIIVKDEQPWYLIRKFTGSQLRRNCYKVHKSELVPIPVSPSLLTSRHIPPEYPSDEDEIAPTDTAEPLRHSQPFQNAPTDNAELSPRSQPLLHAPLLNETPVQALPTHPPDIPQPPPVLTAPASPTESPEHVRPQRNRVPPKRFEDYDMST